MKRQILSIFALGLSLSSMAQVVYTDIPDVTLTPSATRETYNIDINGDNVTDFTAFALDSSLTVSGFPIDMQALGLELAGANKVVGSVVNNTAGDILKVDSISQGTNIDSNLNYVDNSSSANLIFNGGGLYLYTMAAADGDFNNVTDKFIGVQFMIGSALHYGWIRVDAAANSGNLVIKDFAYEGTAGTAIVAGDTGNSTSIDEDLLSNVSVNLVYGNLNINNIEGTYSVSVIDLLGKSIYNNTLNNSASIELGNINKGIYLIQITQGNSLVTKKIYIQ